MISFDAYVVARGPALVRFAFLLVRDHHLAEDLVQEALARSHRRWGSIEGNDPDSYVRRAVLNAFLSWRRRRSSHERPLPELGDDRQSLRPDLASAVVDRDALAGLLESLPRQQRAVIVLRYYEGSRRHRDRRAARLRTGDRASPRVARAGPAAGRLDARPGNETESAMTAEMETALRQVLAEQAAEAPDGARLLAGVHARRRGLALRHRLIALSVAALTAVVAAGASLAGLQLAHRRDNVSSGALAGGLVPVPANWFPAFPVTPGWLPPGLGPARTGYTSHEQIVRLTYVDPTDRARYPDVVRAVHIGVSRTRLFPVQRAVRRAINIGGQSVTAFSGPFTSEGGHGVEVAWERRPGQWVHLQCDSTLGTFENVRRIAESLRDVAVPPTPNFGLAGLPRGLTSLGGYGAAELLLLPDGSRDQNQVSQERMLDVTLKKNVDQRFVPRADIAAPSDHRLVMVGGRPGWLTTGGGGRFLTIAVKRGVILSFRAPATLSESVFLRFAAGVTILPAAQAFDESA